MKLVLMIFIIFLSFVAACDEKKEKDPRNDNYYNVLFITEEGKQGYIGTVKGITSCRYHASRYYTQHRTVLSEKWDYKCCLKTKDDECKEEHKL